jgi:hypothetical protein
MGKMYIKIYPVNLYDTCITLISAIEIQLYNIYCVYL